VTAAPGRVDEVRFEVTDHVATVTIDRQHVLNAVDGKTTARLIEIWEEIERTDVRCVVLTGAGEKAFCTGADMSAQAIEKSGLEYWADLEADGFGGFSLRSTLDVPVIARVNGYALGGGMELVLGCDIVVAAEHAKLGLVEPRVGRLPLDGGMVLLPRKIPHNAAMGLLLTGRRAPAAEFAGYGLINEVVPAAELDAAVDRWVEQILACSPASLRAIKQLTTRTAHLTAREARDARLPAVIASVAGPDADEGVRAFQEKRKPVWQGR